MDDIYNLLEIMRRLRDPDKGCPWDQVQTFATIAPYTIEEAYEVADAIERNDLQGLRDELGDLLFQTVYHAQMASEINAFDFNAVVRGLNDKLIQRHPHVFGDEHVDDAEAQTQAWEMHKGAERRARSPAAGLLDDVPRALPALRRAEKLQARAATVGFDWPDAAGVFEKIREELDELTGAFAQEQPDSARLREELGDLLFAVVNLARHLALDPEQSLRVANAKFQARFSHIEKRLNEQGRDPKDATLEELDALWQEAKTRL